MFLKGEITLNGSKSISNRVLMIQAISGQEFDIKNLSNAKDTVVLNTLLSKLDEPILDAGEAGTAYRFMTAYLAYLGQGHVLIGNKRMCERPIAVLVDALNDLGAAVNYVGKTGFPPLKFNQGNSNNWGNRIEVSAEISSQYTSALLMLAPALPNGLELIMNGKIISRPYIQMTLNLMEEFGILSMWHQDMIKVVHQDYVPKTFVVEADWSAASYYYSLVALSSNAALQLNGLFQESTQGDAVLVQLMEHFGVETTFNTKGVLLTKKAVDLLPFNYDFSDCPDIAQTLAVVCAALNINAQLTGLETLIIKETNRIEALQIELEKLGCDIEANEHSIYIKKGITISQKAIKIATYNDHRMAMAFAPLVLLNKKIIIENQDVVCKSYPNFWQDFKKLGLTVH